MLSQQEGAMTKVVYAPRGPFKLSRTAVALLKRRGIEDPQEYFRDEATRCDERLVEVIEELQREPETATEDPWKPGATGIQICVREIESPMYRIVEEDDGDERVDDPLEAVETR